MTFLYWAFVAFYICVTVFTLCVLVYAVHAAINNKDPMSVVKSKRLWWVLVAAIAFETMTDFINRTVSHFI